MDLEELKNKKQKLEKEIGEIDVEMQNIRNKDHKHELKVWVDYEQKIVSGDCVKSGCNYHVDDLVQLSEDIKGFSLMPF